MTIEELKFARRTLEEELTKLLQKFEADTGVLVTYIQPERYHTVSQSGIHHTRIEVMVPQH